MSPIEDIRFEVIENVADSLRQLLPPPERIVWPAETGDMEAIDRAMRFLKAWLPAASASWRGYKRDLNKADRGTAWVPDVVVSDDLTPAGRASERDDVLAALGANYIRRREAEEEVRGARGELRVLLARGQSVALDVTAMARTSGVSRDTAHRLLRAARAVPQSDPGGA